MARTTGLAHTTGLARSAVTTPGSSVLASSLERVLLWFGEALSYAMGRPAELEASPPPLLGVQPYRDIPRRRH